MVLVAPVHATDSWAAFISRWSDLADLVVLRRILSVRSDAPGPSFFRWLPIPVGVCVCLPAADGWIRSTIIMGSFNLGSAAPIVLLRLVAVEGPSAAAHAPTCSCWLLCRAAQLRSFR